MADIAAVQHIIEPFAAGLRRLYGGRLRQVLVFGSYARGEGSHHSDIDVAVLLDDFDDVCAELDRMGDLIWEVCLEHDTLLAVVPVREADWRDGGEPLLRNLRREGVPAWTPT